MPDDIDLTEKTVRYITKSGRYKVGNSEMNLTLSPGHVAKVGPMGIRFFCPSEQFTISPLDTLLPFGSRCRACNGVGTANGKPHGLSNTAGCEWCGHTGEEHPVARTLTGRTFTELIHRHAEADVALLRSVTDTPVRSMLRAYDQAIANLQET